MASPFFPMSASTRPSLTPPSIGSGGFSTSPPGGSLLQPGFGAGTQPMMSMSTPSLFGSGLMRPAQHGEAEQQLMMSGGHTGSMTAGLAASAGAGAMSAATGAATTPTTTTTAAPPTTTTTTTTTTPSGASVDETQVMSKLQQLMNQMGTFMKSVDARLTTLEKMTGQLMTNQTEQAKSMELRFQEIAQLVQQKSSIIQLQPPPSSQQPMQQPLYAAAAGGYAPAPPTSTAATTSADFEIARQLQEQFDKESQQQQQQQHAYRQQQPQRPGQPLYAPVGGPTMPGIPMQPNLTALQMQQMQPARAETKIDARQPATCPICAIQKPLGEMEEHVNQHFDESEGVVADALDKSKAKEPRGFWDRLFGAEDESPSLQVAAQTPAGPTYPHQPQMLYSSAGQYGFTPAAYPQTYAYRR